MNGGNGNHTRIGSDIGQIVGAYFAAINLSQELFHDIFDHWDGESAGAAPRSREEREQRALD